MYADDHQLFSVAKSSNEAERILTSEGNNISEWYNNNLLQGNFSKYQVMSLGWRNCQKDIHIVIGDVEIDQKSEITVLGITLDHQLIYSSHISKVYRKASFQTGVLLRLRNLIPTSAKVHIVKFAIIPHLIYILPGCLAFLSCFRYQKTGANPRKSVMLRLLLVVPHRNTTNFGLKSTTFIGAKVWNSLLLVCVH